GMKPLFYLRWEERWWFASEAKALLLATGAPRRTDLCALDGLLRLGFVPGPRSLFDGVLRLPAGHRMVIERSGEVGVAAFPKAQSAMPGACDAGELRRRLAAAVESHLDAEVPVGASLSGGLDSSFLVGLMAERLGAGVRTFSLGCPGDQDGRPFARRIAESFRTDHREITVAPDDLWSRLPRVIWQAEEPRSGPLVPNSLLCERAAEDVRVLRLGEGADELFGGYIRFKTALPPLGSLPPSLG